MEKESLGLIETVGLIPAIEAADAGSKAANVAFRGMGHARAGLITVMFVGDVAAVRAAVTAGAAAARQVGKVITEHVIARPDAQLRVTPNGSSPAQRATPALKSEEAVKPKPVAIEVVEPAPEPVKEAAIVAEPIAPKVIEREAAPEVIEVATFEVAVEEQPQPAVEVVTAGEPPEAVMAGHASSSRRNEKEKVRKPKSKRKL